MKQITGLYKCGYSWTTILARGGTKQEINVLKRRYLETECPKCQELHYHKETSA